MPRWISLLEWVTGIGGLWFEGQSCGLLTLEMRPGVACGLICWCTTFLFALPHKGGKFTRVAEVVFHPGKERLAFRQYFQGIDEHGHIMVNTELEGRVPEIPAGASVQIEPYSEIYQYSVNSKTHRGLSG